MMLSKPDTLYTMPRGFVMITACLVLACIYDPMHGPIRDDIVPEGYILY